MSEHATRLSIAAAFSGDLETLRIACTRQYLREAPPHVLDFFAAVATSPDFVEALRDDDVRAAVSDPEMLGSLGRDLQAKARSARRSAGLAVQAPVYDFTELVAGCPALVAALADPAVARMLRESPRTLDELAALLRLASEAPTPDNDSPAAA